MFVPEIWCYEPIPISDLNLVRHFVKSKRPSRWLRCIVSDKLLHHSIENLCPVTVVQWWMKPQAPCTLNKKSCGKSWPRHRNLLSFKAWPYGPTIPKNGEHSDQESNRLHVCARVCNWACRHLGLQMPHHHTVLVPRSEGLSGLQVSSTKQLPPVEPVELVELCPRKSGSPQNDRICQR